MIKPLIPTIFIFSVFVHPGSLALAQDSAAALIAEIQKAYNEMNFVEARIKAETALQNYQNFSAAQLTEVHKTLGLIYYSQNNPDQSRNQFETALSLDPQLNLDPLFVSPKILDFFNEIKRTWLQKNQQNGDIRDRTRYIMMYDPRPAAAMRSMIFPGWGQRYKGEKRKGLILSGLWGVGIIGAAVAHIARSNAEDKYLSETNPARIDSRFDTFNTLHKLRNNLLVFSAGVWLFSYFDAILKPAANKNGPSTLKDAVIRPSIRPGRLSVNLLMNF
ncbi:MAG: tetratricopeptide repeat protein [bacterium]